MKYAVISTHNNTVFYYISDRYDHANWTSNFNLATQFDHPDTAEDVVRRLRRTMITQLSTVPFSLLSDKPQNPITCKWTGRHGDSVEVFNATSREEAREHALKFAEIPEGEGITLDDGFLSTWSYDDPKPEDWQDTYVFRSVDEHPVDQREWWEK